MTEPSILTIENKDPCAAMPTLVWGIQNMLTTF